MSQEDTSGAIEISFSEAKTQEGGQISIFDTKSHSEITIEQQKKPEEHLDVTFEIADEEMKNKIRDELQLGFIRKVYGILSFQFLITIIFSVIAIQYKEIGFFMQENTWIMWSCFIISSILLFVMFLWKDASRKVPINYILLFLWTTCEAYIVATLTSIFDPSIVLLAASGTLVMTIAMTIYACFAKTNFSLKGGLLSSGLGILFLLTVFSFFIPILQAIIALFGICLYSLFLIFDTMRIIGRFEKEFSQEDYIIAALMVYMDIIEIFLYMLQCLAIFSGFRR
jgi:FtsH-binding integral membrane protein